MLVIFLGSVNRAVHWAVQSTLNFDLIDRANFGSCIFFARAVVSLVCWGRLKFSVTFFVVLLSKL